VQLGRELDMKKAILALAVLALFCSQASAALVLLDDNFDSYANQAAFQAAWPAVTSPNSGTLSTARFDSPPNSIHNVATTGATPAAQRNQRSFAESGLPSPTNLIRFSFDFYDSNAAASPHRNHTNLQDGAGATGNGQLIAMGLNNNQTSAQNGNHYMGRILGYNPNEGTGANTAGAFFKLNGPGAPLRSTGWHNLRVDITNTSYSFYVDGILSEVVPNTVTLRSYDIVRLGSGLSNAGVEAYWDNVFVATAVPEASSFIALGLVGAISAGAVWLRKKRAGVAAA
jgi:hypothetical protein